MTKHFLTASFFAIFTSSLLAADAAPAEKAAPNVWEDDFTKQNYVIQRIDGDKEKKGSCRKEYKDGSIILYYKFDAGASGKAQGTFVYGIAKPIDLKGSNVLEIRYRTPVKGLGNIVTWTYADANGKLSGDWTRLPASEEWKTLQIKLDQDGFGAKKKAKPEPAKLSAFDIYSSSKADGVERALEIDYLRVPAK